MSASAPRYYAHESALIEEGAEIGAGSKIWHDVHVRRGARIGARCIVGKGVYIDFDVQVGDDCKIQNYACLYHGVSLGRGVFVGPHAVFTNDLRPRATSPDFTPLKDGEWLAGTSHVGDGAAIGANATILPDVRIGRWAMIGAGAVVTRSVPDYAVVLGAPARIVGYVCSCGTRVSSVDCPRCGNVPSNHPLRSKFAAAASTD